MRRVRGGGVQRRRPIGRVTRIVTSNGNGRYRVEVRDPPFKMKREVWFTVSSSGLASVVRQIQQLLAGRGFDQAFVVNN